MKFKNLLKMIKPVQEFKTESVKKLLFKFYELNFEKAGVDTSIADELVKTAWEAKNNAGSNETAQKVKELFTKAKLQVKYPMSEVLTPLNLFDFKNVKSFADIGANKLDAINYLAQTQKQIETLIGIDVIPQRSNFTDPSRSRFIQISEDNSNIPLKDSTVDFVNIQFVMHHMQSDNVINDMLSEIYRITSKGGKFLVWEESFTQQIDINQLIDQNKQINIAIDELLTEEFYSLSEAERFEFIIINDWLINPSNPHMQWTGLYKTWEKWKQLIISKGFKLEKEYNFGLRVSGRLKHGVHMLGLFSKL